MVTIIIIIITVLQYYRIILLVVIIIATAAEWCGMYLQVPRHVDLRDACYSRQLVDSELPNFRRNRAPEHLGGRRRGQAQGGGVRWK